MENIWNKYDQAELVKLNKICDDFKVFLSNCKTERECIYESVKMAKKSGYKNLFDCLKSGQKLKRGDKVYAINMDKALILLNIGKEPFEKGLNIIGSHIDSPRLDLKSMPIYENSELCLLDTHYYGGIKKYQWVTIPLALHGVVVKKDGTKIDIIIGEKDTDPVFCISDLLPHLDKDHNDKKKEVVLGEDLNLLVGSIPLESAEKDKVKANILKILKTMNIEESDLISAEIEVVPAGHARDVGLDRSMILGYGQDDRVCAFSSLTAMLEINKPDKTAVCMLVDKEEIGSVGATGMKSKFFENILAETMHLCEDYSELKLRRALTNSKMISSDVTAAFDPNYPSPMNKDTEAFFARGISFNKYTGSRGKSGSNDANPEFIAQIRNILDLNNVYYQFNEMGRVDAGGGGTIAYIMASYGMDVIDAGVPLLSMHAPWEVSCKADIYESFKAYKAFYTLK